MIVKIGITSQKSNELKTLSNNFSFQSVYSERNHYIFGWVFDVKCHDLKTKEFLLHIQMGFKHGGIFPEEMLGLETWLSVCLSICLFVMRGSANERCFQRDATRRDATGHQLTFSRKQTESPQAN